MDSAYITDLCNKHIIYISTPKTLYDHYYIKCNSFRFKVVLFPTQPRTCQLMCLDTFKVMTWDVVKSTVAFKDYFDTSSQQATLFNYIADDVAISFVVDTYKKILVFNQGLFLRDTSGSATFTDEDSTMFELHRMDDTYKKQLSILTNTPAQFPLFVKFCRPIENLSQLFYILLSEYDYLADHVLISLDGKVVFPVDYYLDGNDWCYVDRKYDIASGTYYKRKGFAPSLAQIQSLPESEGDWVASAESTAKSESTEKSEVHLLKTEKSEVHPPLPKQSSMLLVLHKILGITISEPIMYSSLHTYCVSKALIHKRPKAFYNTLYTLLQKNTDAKVHTFIKMMLFTIFYYVKA